MSIGGPHEVLPSHGRSRYVIAFAKSSSRRYAEAEALAASVPGSRLTEAHGVRRHQVPVHFDRLPTLDRLLGLVAGWRSTQLFVDGVEVRRLRELVSLELQRGHITGNSPQRRRSLRR